jgi:hypothetical protein
VRARQLLPQVVATVTAATDRQREAS